MQTIGGRGTGVVRTTVIPGPPRVIIFRFYWSNEHVGEKGRRIFYAGNHRWKEEEIKWNGVLIRKFHGSILKNCPISSWSNWVGSDWIVKLVPRRFVSISCPDDRSNYPFPGVYKSAINSFVPTFYRRNLHVNRSNEATSGPASDGNEPSRAFGKRKRRKPSGDRKRIDDHALSLSLSPLLVPLRGEIIERWGNNGAPLCANSKVARLPNTRI